MRRFNVKLSCCIGFFLLITALVSACGSGGEGDILDENGQRYAAYVSFKDAEESGTLDIDVIRNLDCDGNGVLDDPEIFTNAYAAIEISVSKTAPGITLQDYTIEYIPLLSPDSIGVYRMPPDLIDLTSHGSSTFAVYPGDSEEITITCMSVDSKADYVAKVAADPNLANLLVSRYTIRITLNFEDEYRVEREIVVERTVYLANFDNC